MSKSETLNEELKKYLKILDMRRAKVHGCAVVDSDGLIIASKIKGSENEMAVGAITGVLSSLSERIRSEFNSGLFRNAVIETHQLLLIFTGVGDEAILTTIADANSDVEVIKPYARIFASKIHNILTGKVEIKKAVPLEDEKVEIKQKPVHKFISKGLILGDYAVGKTSILTRFTQYKFTVEYKQTLGLNVVKKEYFLENYKGELTQVDLVLWDLAAQIRDMHVRHDYYAGADFVMVLFDVTRPETMDGALHWYRDCYKTLQENPNPNREPVFILIGNKIDLPRMVERSEGEAMAKSLGIPYIETSAKTAENVEEAFKTVISEFVNRVT
ncbi:MAG: GTP-binding protein [Candidatus Helarchaeota archaeon]